MSYSKIVSLLNRRLDWCQAVLSPNQYRFRRRLCQIIDEAKRSWSAADYGAGYLYQSFPRLHLRGFRRTDVRVAQMNIRNALARKRVLEIGCNTGFLSLELSNGTSAYLGIDNNPFLIEIANLAQGEVSDRTVKFLVEHFEEFNSDEKFDVALSFANHSTWDGNMTLELSAYFQKLQNLLVPGGLLFFESHHPALEDKRQLEETLKVMTKFFVINEQRLLRLGSPWDRGRLFVTARALPVAV